MTKPRVKYIREYDLFICLLRNEHVIRGKAGSGRTVEEAYHDWKQNNEFFVRSRKGWWNKSSTVEWKLNGCKLLSFICIFDDIVVTPIDYIPETDCFIFIKN